MNKITLITAGVIVSAVAVVGYNFLGDDVGLTKGQQELISESAQVKAPTVESNILNNPLKVTVEKNSEQEKVIGDANRYVRAAPPPPISSPHHSNDTKDSGYTSPKAHGHEEVIDNQKKNAPPPPRGAN
jgi:hypothetical protein